MKIIETGLPGVLIIQPKVHGDRRGFFVETFHADRYREAGINEAFVQDNHSRSMGGVLRGLHYQLERPQGKLVRVVRGRAYDVAVDVRRDSPTFGRWVSVILDDVSHQQLYLPPGFAHGFCVVSDQADLAYRCTDYYHPDSEQGIVWDDPELAIDWPLEQVILSPKDAGFPTLAEQDEAKLPPYQGSR